jgi:hypothetical protein
MANYKPEILAIALLTVDDAPSWLMD